MRVRPGEVPEFMAEGDAALMRGVARIGRKWSRLPTLEPALADRGPYELKRRHGCLDEHHRNLVWETLLAEFGAWVAEGQVVVDPPPGGGDEDEDAAAGEDLEDAEDEPTPRGGGSLSETAVFPFCLYHRPRVVAANPSLSAPQIAHRLAGEWPRLSAPSGSLGALWLRRDGFVAGLLGERLRGASGD
jgi:hypothetical protein